jgi:meso-butanediol dehydrogenase/(S,S)-butanediol dehydrogenase/diacetyl reductase
MIGLTRVMALEVGAANIQVNAVCPGEVDTDLQRWGWQLEAGMRGTSYEEVVKVAVSRIPVGRLEVPEDVANLVAFLASPESDYITGQAINVDGGIVMH